MTRLFSIRALTAFTLIIAPSMSFAHTGLQASNSFYHGILHPFSGLDHLFAMIAVGLWAAQLGGKAKWLVPLTFVSVMLLGGLLGASKLGFAFIELGILLSICALGYLIASATRLSLAVCALLVGVFALFHGYAHGAEMPVNAFGLSYTLGFILSTFVLHFAGLLTAKWLRPETLRWTGAGIALIGGGLFFAG
jgi:urease accessory protein